MFVFKDSWSSAKLHFGFACQTSSFLYLIRASNMVLRNWLSTQDFCLLLVLKASLCVSALLFYFLNKKKLLSFSPPGCPRNFILMIYGSGKYFQYILCMSAVITLQDFSPHSSVKGSKK